ncbi:serine hydrolase [Thermosynechococcaceae cyanobacterium BACA0444]|uniref:Serine hydrolase n=1 Tax=Pseudocalidococcus azoricus BACA0444 TaxID=2918990 RepID=A0AAE4JXA1_9CYAN|nr:serine hydrolase [Pseudocalidococcus azoricus]MDS3860938.1 serine hydrolase [Pseudocalidococcus azoricus BACA0444]
MTFFQVDTTLAVLGEQVLNAAWDKFSWLGRDDIALAWLVYSSPVIVNTGGALSPVEFWQYPVRGYSYRGDVQIYPASIVKLFYLVAAQEWQESGMLPPNQELDRALRDMIVDSSNDATGLVMDLLSGTTSGPELPPGPFGTWQYQRNIVNRYFQSLAWPELTEINVNQKTWCDGPYGRENAFVGVNKENRNRLSVNATIRLLHSIVGGVAVSSERSQAMLNLMARSLNPEDLAADPENQVSGFLGGGLPFEAKLWSKAGLTSWVRHDAAYIELPGKCPFSLVVFLDSKLASTNEGVLPFIAEQICVRVPALDESR